MVKAVIRLVLGALMSSPLICLASPLVLQVEGEIKNTFSYDGEITLLDDAHVTSHSWNQSEDLKSVSPSGALRFENLESDDRHAQRFFYEIDPKTAQSKFLFYIDTYTFIKKWQEDGNGIHIQYCYNNGAPALDFLDVANGNYKEIPDCAIRAILMPNSEYWSFTRDENDHLNRTIYTTAALPLYPNLRPLDISTLPADTKFESEKIALSANSRFLALQDFEYSKNGTYVYDFQTRTISQFKSARGGGYDRAIPSNDGKLVSSYGTAKLGNVISSVLAIYVKDQAEPVMKFIPTVREDDSEMWQFADSNFTLDDARIITTASSRARDPNTQLERRDVDIFDVKTGEQILRLKYSWVVRYLGQNRALVQSWDDHSYRVLDYGQPTPKITHRFSYPPGADLSREMNSSFAGNTFAMTYAKKTYFFELPPSPQPRIYSDDGP